MERCEEDDTVEMVVQRWLQRHATGDSPRVLQLFNRKFTLIKRQAVMFEGVEGVLQ